MSTLGILLACDHYPAVSANEKEIDAQLRIWLVNAGTSFNEIRVFKAYDGDVPRHAASSDAWILSGMPLPTFGSTDDVSWALRQFLRAAASFRRPIYAVNHGEHILHSALASFEAVPPSTPVMMRSIRNPFRSFLSRDQLFRFNPGTRTVDALERPFEISQRGVFGTFLAAA